MNRLFSRLTALALSAAVLFTPTLALDLTDAQALVETYYAGSIPQSAYQAETAADFVAALGDPYSQYFTAEEYAAFLESMEDSSLVGIGVTARSHELGLEISEILSGSSAEEAGLQAGDILTAADGVSLGGLSLDDAIAYIRGEEGTSLRLVYLRDGKTHRLTLTRRSITIPATDGQILAGRVGYIACTTFGQDTLAHFTDLITEMEPEVDSYLIDLRDNTGGLTDAAAQSAGLFVGTSGIIQLRYPSGEYDIYRHDDAPLTTKPLIVLVNEYSASASEAFAAIIRDTSRGLVLGSRTYGKGVAQGLLDSSTMPTLFDDDALKLTIARFYSVLGNTTDRVGVIPDLLMDPDYADLAAWLMLAQPAEDSDALLSFSLDGDRFTLDLNWMETEDDLLAFAMMLDALPQDTVFELNGLTISRDHLAEEYSLSLTQQRFLDADAAEYPAILEEFRRKGLLSGDQTGTFHPDDTLTRAQLCQMLYNLLNGQAISGFTSFSDVADDAWYRDAVNYTAQLGFVSGVGENCFNPDGVLDTQQFIAILGRFARWLNCDFEDDAAWWDAQSLSLYPDYPDWAQTSLWLLNDSQSTSEGEYSLLWTNLDELDPTAPISREIAVYGLYRVLSYLTYL